MTWECDSNGHMNVMYYINKFEHAGRNFDLEMGLLENVDKDKKWSGRARTANQIPERSF